MEYREKLISLLEKVEDEKWLRFLYHFAFDLFENKGLI